MAGTIIFGLHAVEEALQAPQRVNRLLLGKETKNPDLHNLLDLAKSLHVRWDIVPIAKLNSMTGTFEHQGVAAEISPLEYTPLEDLLATIPQKSLLIVLDQVQLERNVGMIIRTAAAAGASGVLLATRGSALLDENIVRSSAGMVFHIPVCLCNNIAQTLRKLKDHGFWIYGLDAQGEGNAFNEEWPDRCALVMGNESKGLRHGVSKACDRRIHIPMAGNTESLNVAVCAGITAFQVANALGLLTDKK